MNENMNVVKPITLLREEFIENVATLCNSSGLPFFIIESVLRDFVQEVNIASRKQFETDRLKYNQEVENLQFQKDNENINKDND